MFNYDIPSIEDQATTILKFHQCWIIFLWNRRLADEFLPLDVQKLYDTKDVLGDVLTFYKNWVDYLKKWISPFQTFELFAWIALQTVSQWKDVRHNVSSIVDIPQLIVVETLYDELLWAKSFIQGVKIQK